MRPPMKKPVRVIDEPGPGEDRTSRQASCRGIRGGCRRPLQVGVRHGRGCRSIRPNTQVDLSDAPDRDLRRRNKCPHSIDLTSNHRWHMNDLSNGFELLLGHATFKLWPDLPRDMQEKLFEAAVPDNPLLRYSFAVFLHDHHPRTAHPPKPQPLPEAHRIQISEASPTSFDAFARQELFPPHVARFTR